MKRNTQIVLIITLLLLLAFLPVLNLAANAQWVDPPIETQPTSVPWNYVPDNGDAVHPQGWVAENIVQEVTERPMLYIVSYDTGDGKKSVNPYGNFGLTFTIGNNGLIHARNIILQNFDHTLLARNLLLHLLQLVEQLALCRDRGRNPSPGIGAARTITR